MEDVLEKNIQKIFELLKTKNLNFASCESYTGGGFANTITNVKGSSEFFLGSLVTYSNFAKTKIVKVKKRVIKKYGAVSQQCAESMALGTRKVLKADLAISFTGNADKDVMENKKPFSGYITINYLAKVKSWKFDLSNNKNMNRETFKKESIFFGIEKILEILEK